MLHVLFHCCTCYWPLRYRVIYVTCWFTWRAGSHLTLKQVATVLLMDWLMKNINDYILALEIKGNFSHVMYVMYVTIRYCALLFSDA